MRTSVSTMSPKAVILSAVISGLVLGSYHNAAWAGRFAQQHPRRAEVLGRDNNINRRINNNYGNLGGHYGQPNTRIIRCDGKNNVTPGRTAAILRADSKDSSTAKRTP